MPAEKWVGVRECSLTGTDSCTKDWVHLKQFVFCPFDACPYPGESRSSLAKCLQITKLDYQGNDPICWMCFYREAGRATRLSSRLPFSIMLK